MSILTDRVIFSGPPASNDLIHIVDVSDPTDNPAGTSFAIEVGDLVPTIPFTSLTTTGTTGPSTLVSGILNVPEYAGVTFTGNTSGDCITDLHITNLYGCSPLHIEPSGLSDVYMVENGGNVAIGHDTPTEKLHVKNGDILVEGSNGKVYSVLSSSAFRLSAGTSDLSTIGVTTPSNGALAIGTRGSTAVFPGYGEQGDGFIYSSANQHGLNIISQDGTGTDYIRFYAGKDCTDVADMFIVGAQSAENGYIGMGTETPTEKLHVEGSIKMVDGNEQNGYVMTSDANGVGSWVSAITEMSYASSDATTPLVVATNIGGMFATHDMTIDSVFAGVAIVGSGGGVTDIDILVNGVSIFSGALTELTIDSGEATSLTAATVPVIANPNISRGDRISTNVTTLTTGGTEAGLQITLNGLRT